MSGTKEEKKEEKVKEKEKMREGEKNKLCINKLSHWSHSTFLDLISLTNKRTWTRR